MTTPEPRAGGLLLAWLLPGWTRTRVLLGAILGALVGALLVFSPVGPWAMAQGEVRFAQGDAAGAMHHWDRVGRWHPLGSVRVQADLRAASVASTVLGDRAAARRYLQRVVRDERPASRVLARAWGRLGTLWAEEVGHPTEALDAWRMALSMAPDAEAASAWRVGIAETLAETGDLQGALLAWDQVIDADRALADRARLHQGALLLAVDDVVGALEAYDLAATSLDPAVRQAARLGAASTRARLGEIDDALADLAAAGLPEAVAAARAEALRGRLEDSDEE